MTLTDDSPATTPTSRQWWKSAVVYQVYPRSFQDSDGDGIGDLRGIRHRLDHLERLGVDVIWLSPIYRSPHADNGYDISDYRDIDPVFGTLADFDELLADVHARGMKLVMDLVVNHTSDEHPWFAESRSSRDNPKRDWYWWRPPREGMPGGQAGAEPTNWRSFFSGPTWTFDETTGEYYLHLFDRKQPDLNWENPEVRQAVHEIMRWWLDRGVDGFRMDVINLISKDPRLPDGVVGSDGLLGDGSPHYTSGPRIHEFLQELHREVFDGRPGEYLTVGEMPGVTSADAVLFTDPARRELDMVFQFEHVSLDQGVDKFDVLPRDLVALKASLGRWQRELGEVGWNSLYWNNHDQPRAVSRFGNDSPEHWRNAATALAAVLHLHRGTPYIFQGEELGMTNASFGGVDEFRDLESLNYLRFAALAGRDSATALIGVQRMSRDNARTPMQWDGSRHAGFTTAEPWIAVNDNHAWLNAAAQHEDPDSVFQFHRRLIELRHTDPIVVDGSFTMLLPEHEQLYAYVREHLGVRLLVVANLSDAPAEWIAPAWGNLVLHNGRSLDPTRLAPWEARVYRGVEPSG